jgi:hypothetical protein
MARETSSLAIIGALITSLFVTGCAANAIGNMTGTVIQGETSGSININFDAVTFPSENLGSGQFNIELTNISGDGINIILAAKNPSGATLTTQFPLGSYVIDGNANQFLGSVAFAGLQVASIMGSSGGFNLLDFQIGVDASGNPAVGLIAGEFSVTLAGGGTVSGDFQKSFF